MLALSGVQVLTGCGDGGGGDASSADEILPPPQPGSANTLPAVTPVPPLHGHFRGTAAVGGDTHEYHAEALITADGAVRLYVGGPVYVGGLVSGAGVTDEVLDPAESLLLLGNVTLNGDHADGDGVVIGQSCDPAGGGRFCGQPAMAELRIEQLAPSHSGHGPVGGEVRIGTTTGEEVWLLDMVRWSVFYDVPNPHSSAVGANHPSGITSSHGGPVGMFQEVLARFARGDDVLITIDDHGRLFFQGPASDCTGNGTLQRHGNGEFHVFDVDLLVEGCNASYAFLNGRFEGLSTETQSGYWSYDNWLLMFLATPETSGPRFALTMLAPAIAAP